MTTASKTALVLDAIAESLEDCSPRLSAEIDAVAFAIDKTHPAPGPDAVVVLDEVADVLETRGAYKLAMQADRLTAAAEPVSAASPSSQVASMLSGMLNQMREHLRTVGGQMSYYINGAGHEQLDDNERRLLDRAKKKLDAWEKQQLKVLHDIANDVRKI